MEGTLDFLGHWSWWIIAGLMFVLELVAPAFFFLWLGVAAIFTALLLFVVDLGWQGQLAAFAVFSLICLALSRVLVRLRPSATDQPMLNRRDESLIGRDFVLAEPIRNGRGWIRVDDTVWQVEGPDLDVGVKVRVAASNRGILKVELAEMTA